MNHAVQEIKALKKKKNSNEALQLLKRIASQVLPIMRKRGWKVQHLCEFYPTNPNLLGLNVNHGFKINIRLRPHYDDTVFLDYNDLLGTMLHELVHIVRGPHDATFYKILDELNDELDQLLLTGQKGYSAFDGVGHKLGDNTGFPLSPLAIKNRALVAAEQRRQVQRVMLPTGGVRLGGSTPNQLEKSLTPKQMAAQAAERRLRDQKWCGGLQEESADDDNTTPNDPQTSTVIVLDDDDDNNTANTNPSGRKRGRDDDDDDDNQGSLTTKRHHATWICAICTFENQELVLACAMCLSERTNAVDTSNSKTTSWACPQCTLLNDMATTTCDACAFNKA